MAKVPQKHLQANLLKRFPKLAQANLQNLSAAQQARLATHLKSRVARGKPSGGLPPGVKPKPLPKAEVVGKTPGGGPGRWTKPAPKGRVRAGPSKGQIAARITGPGGVRPRSRPASARRAPAARAPARTTQRPAARRPVWRRRTTRRR